MGSIVAMKTQKQIPFDFVIDELSCLSPIIKTIFGSHGIYVSKAADLIRGKKQGREQIFELQQKRLEVAQAFLNLISRSRYDTLTRLKEHVEKI